MTRRRRQPEPKLPAVQARAQVDQVLAARQAHSLQHRMNVAETACSHDLTTQQSNSAKDKTDV